MDKHPKPVVGAFIFNEKGELLLAKSYKWGDHWIVPGGHIDWGESIEETVIREVKEEVGLSVKNVKLIATYEGIFPKEFHDKRHFIYLQCRCEAVRGEEVKIDEKEINTYNWFSLEDALKLDGLLKITKKTIELLIGKKQQ